MPPQPGEIVAPLVEATGLTDLGPAVRRVGLAVERPVIVVVGGAGQMSDGALGAVTDVLRDAVVPVAQRHTATVVDGGTDSGVMRVMGRAHALVAATFPLVGVAAVGTVAVGGHSAPSVDSATLDPHHSHFLLVPGDEWGAEVEWIADTASVIAGSRPSVTVLCNGGEIAYRDAACSVDRQRPLIVLDGTGRAADEIAGARAGRTTRREAVEIAGSPLTRIVDVEDTGAVRDALESVLGRPS